METTKLILTAATRVVLEMNLMERKGKNDVFRLKTLLKNLSQ